MIIREVSGRAANAQANENPVWKEVQHLRLRMFFEYKPIKDHIAKCFTLGCKRPDDPEVSLSGLSGFSCSNCKELVTLALTG
jgi:hypothetical protein